MRTNGIRCWSTLTSEERTLWQKIATLDRDYFTKAEYDELNDIKVNLFWHDDTSALIKRAREIFDIAEVTHLSREVC